MRTLFFLFLIGVAYSNAQVPHEIILPDPLIRIDDKGSFSQPKLLSVEPDGIKISHASGVAKIPLNVLPTELRNSFSSFVSAAAEKASQAASKDEQKSQEMTKSSDLPESQDELVKLLNEYKERLDHMDKLLANIPKEKPQQTAIAPVHTDTSNGDPALWSKVTQRSLGKVFIQGQGWLAVGPNGPIPGGNQRVGGVKTRDQMSRELIEKAAAKKGVDVAPTCNFKSSRKLECCSIVRYPISNLS